MAPSLQSTRNGKPVNRTRQGFLKVLKNNVTESALKTLPADPNMESVPTKVTAMLNSAGNALLTGPQSKYNCMTEEKLPIAPGHKSDPFSLWIGLGGGYPTPDHAAFAAYKLNIAAMEWNSLDIGVTFKWVTDIEDACFVLTYGGDEGSVLARAFFPNDRDLNALFVYQRAFDEKTSPYQSNIFLHELGHVLGLRHEFAAEEGGAVEFGRANPQSVMGYVFPPNIQVSDVESATAFYKIKEHEGLKVVDWNPNN
ncbi:metallopeptidase, catalytic domain-containing [Trichoderma arundinaceum]|uniref:Metallopeptidase, catalytic domain-containing n=1 Tax=Trichoderma arundinaceum TaxID=490622 RepID=A0A395NCU9_TRIAR|nr:metallopeptidase, catalytic domain-containing [Trichoderma arundinaceum]